MTVGTPYGAPTAGITITIPQQTQQCYPTEQALQAKAKRKQVKEEQGISGRQQQKATKTNKYVEEHYDDCGGDFTPLMPTTAASYYDDYDEYFFDYYDTQHKFFTSVDLQFYYGPYYVSLDSLPTTTNRHDNAMDHFFCLQQQNNIYHSIELQLEINHCIDGNYRIVSRHGNSYYAMDHATTQPGPMPATTLQYMCDVLTEFPPSCLTLSTTNGFDTTTFKLLDTQYNNCLLYTSPSPRDRG